MVNNGSSAVQEWVTGGVVQVQERFKWHHFQLIEIARPKNEFTEGIFGKTLTRKNIQTAQLLHIFGGAGRVPNQG